MTDVCLLFEVHQPFRLNRNFHQDVLGRQGVSKAELFDLYFDHGLNRHIFERAVRKCYFPSNDIILEQIDAYKNDRRRFKVAYGISGVFIEQCERWNTDLLDSFKQLVASGCVELLDQPYYHSLSSLYGIDRSEFVDQICMHRQLMKDLLGYEPRIVENTECLYNNAIGATVEGLGYEAMVTEGTERIIGLKSPNHVYQAKGMALRILLRNYRLSDDIGFRFSSTRWKEWPLTADKYASWLASTPGQTITLFVDYETFGEHHWPESGIHEFLRWLPREVMKWGHLQWSTPSEVIRRYEPIGEIDVSVFNTISWADLERDPSAWLNNSMQQACYRSLKRLEQPVKTTGDKELLRFWRYLQMSDHLYYMSIKGGGSGDVHSYFNPCGSAVEAFTTYSRIIQDLELRVMLELERPELRAHRILRQLPSERGFNFFQESARPSPKTACSLVEFSSAIKLVAPKSIRFHIERGDFERWVRETIGDEELAAKIATLPYRGLRSNRLRRRLLEIVEKRVTQLQKQVAKVTSRSNDTHSLSCQEVVA
ncbi:MAG: glycoside hydrolase family 57 protein [Candidatus Bathyarchaeota archaeon]|nr:MAG: glycoside hydrolase family 57 protein [Candidatus Bathyarchaeota archaeon]